MEVIILKKYKKKPLIIKAIQIRELFEKSDTDKITIGNYKVHKKDKYVIMETIEGNMKAYMNDFLIQGIVEEIYPCREDLFYKTYDIV